MDKRYPHPFGKVRQQYAKLRQRLPLEASKIALDEFKFNFRLGGYRGDNGVVFWKDRKTNKGKGRAILVKTGRLRRSLRAAPVGQIARVVTDVPYANAHNQGFSGTVKVKGFYRKKYTKTKRGRGVYSTKTRKELQETVKKETGRVFVRRHSRKVNLVARPFMITGQPLIRNIEKRIFELLDQIWKQA